MQSSPPLVCTYMQTTVCMNTLYPRHVCLVVSSDEYLSNPHRATAIPQTLLHSLSWTSRDIQRNTDCKRLARPSNATTPGISALQNWEVVYRICLIGCRSYYLFHSQTFVRLLFESELCLLTAASAVHFHVLVFFVCGSSLVMYEVYACTSRCYSNY